MTKNLILRAAFLFLTSVVFLSLSGCSIFLNALEGALSSYEEAYESAGDSSSAWESPEEELPFSYYLDPRIPAPLRDSVLERRKSMFLDVYREDAQLEEKIRELLTTGLDKEFDQELSNRILIFPETPPAQITAAEAEEDLEFLFDYLKYGYAGYGYMGGDDHFLPVKEALLEDLSAAGEELASEDFAELLMNRLGPAIPDNHFYLEGWDTAEYFSHIYYSTSEDLLFEKKDGDYVTMVEGEEYRLATVDGNPPGEYIKPILTADGHPAWAIGITHVGPDYFTPKLGLVPTAGGETLKIAINLDWSDDSYYWDMEDVSYRLTEVSGVPVMENRRLWPWRDEEPAPELEQMVADASTLREEPALILDLRGNEGGYSEWAYEWIQGYTGMNPSFNNIMVCMNTYTVNASCGDGFFGAWMPSGGSPGWIMPSVITPTKLPNENLVLVLVDQYTASSGELFLKYLQQMENVLVIGTNTLGCLTFGSVREVYLPHSKLELSCGFELILEPDLGSIEGAGLHPDLWTPPGESLDRAVAFLSNYFSDDMDAGADAA